MPKQKYVGIHLKTPKNNGDTMKLTACPVLKNSEFSDHVETLMNTFKAEHDRDQITEKHLRWWNYIRYEDKCSEVIMYIPVDFTDPFSIGNNIRMLKNKGKVVLYKPTRTYWLEIHMVCLLIIFGIVLGSAIAKKTYPF